MARKCKVCDPHELCEECPEWIFTLADLIMCMMGLFVILWVLKPNPGEEKPQQAAAAQTDQWLETLGEIRGGFGWEPDPASSDPVDQVMIRKRDRRQGPGDGGRTELERKGAEGTDPEVTTIRKGDQATVGGRMLFDPGSAVFTRETLRLIDEIADQIRGHRNIVMIKGHTSLDDLPDTATAQQKMDLSLRRAQAVADHLITLGISPDILRVQGCSTFETVIQRVYTANSQGANRRVEVEATAQLVEDLQQ